jgi:uncharacterized protein (TIGR02453 family)
LPAKALRFLAQLKKNNNRDWFQAHKEEYEEYVKGPMQELVLRIGDALRRTAPEIVAEPKTALYRIYRDTRFSRDKTPYKTHAAAVFPVRGLPKNAGPSLYFHVAADEVLIGGGMYMPDAGLLRAVREEIAARPRAFLRIVEGPAFRRAFEELEGEQLKTAPKGFPRDHPAARYLRYKQFLFGEIHPAGLATTRQLLPRIVRCFENGMPLIRFLKRPAERAVALSREAEALRSERVL